MKYYRVKKDSYDYFSKHAVIENELLTEKERNRKCPHISDNVFDVVNIPKTKVFWSFGVRFESKQAE